MQTAIMGGAGLGLQNPHRITASILPGTCRRYNGNALIIVDLSNDPTYAEVLPETLVLG